MMICTTFVVFTVLAAVSRGEIVMQNAASLDLANVLETTYCTQGNGQSICNDPQGKVCRNNLCVSACQIQQLNACNCPSTQGRCTVCCGDTSNACRSAWQLGIFEPTGNRWYRHSSVETCYKDSDLTNSQLCPAEANGKVCDIVVQPGDFRETPYVCQSGRCERLLCKLLRNDVVVRTCTCVGEWYNHPICCEDPNTGVCSPFVQWLQQGRAPDYIAFVRRPSQPRPPTDGPAVPIIQAWRTCTGTQTEGQRCGSFHICRGTNCEHICGNPSFECVCAPGQAYECHLCCLQGRTCVSMVENLANPSVIRTVGVSCNFTYGTCDASGSCLAVRQHPAFSVCQYPENDGVTCGPLHQCVAGKCLHICGTDERQCLCAPGSLQECHQCCLVGNNQCVSVLDNIGKPDSPVVPVRFRYRPVNSPCNFTYGACTSVGTCLALPNHPGLSLCGQNTSNDGKPCGDKQVCREGLCQHICGSVLNECECTAGGTQECHQCCLQSDGRCASVYQDGKPFAQALLKPFGTLCNFTYGVCDQLGMCRALLTHPGQSLCTKPNATGQPCGEKFWCQGGQCQHICGSALDECDCAAGGPSDCHRCCRQANGSCASIFDAGKTGSSLLLKPTGASCNFTYGACEPSGVCRVLLTHPGLSLCARPNMTGEPCGEKHWCQSGQCQHICASPQTECECAPGEANECHRCCRHPDGNCSSMFATGSNPNRSLLLKPVGTACNFTVGVCTANGQCETVTRHPFYSMCQYAENYGNQCGEEYICTQDRQCRHMCGSEAAECECSPDSGKECHRCCLNGSTCDSATLRYSALVADLARNQFLYKPVGSNCNYTFGQCSGQGVCAPRTSHPAYSVCRQTGMNGSVCGEQRICINESCTHVCGTEANVCLCDQNSAAACHICCKRNGTCGSVYDGKSSNLLRPMGSPCNYSLGICNDVGMCQFQLQNPALGLSCQLELNKLKQCAPRFICKDFGCRHVCGATDECQCAPGTPDECNTCCYNSTKTPQSCVPAYSLHGVTAAQFSFLYKREGSSCTIGGTEGVCNGNGGCTPTLSYCGNQQREGKQCGRGKVCRATKCDHVCGNGQDCECSGKNGCTVCCKGTGNTCELRAFDPLNPFLFRNAGLPCNDTDGVCDDDGSCVDRSLYFKDSGKLPVFHYLTTQMLGIVLLCIYCMHRELTTP